jgi:toxin secretion/phage lysis holin
MYAPLPNVGPMNWIDAMEHLDTNPLLFTLAVLILADVITGISKSLVTSTTDSSIGKKGFAIHITIILLVWLLYPWSIAIGYKWVGDAVLWLWIFMYATSVTENVGQMGLPLPRFIKDRLNKFSNRAENGEPKKENKEEK